MKKVLTGITAITLLAACGAADVEPENNQSESIDTNVNTAENEAAGTSGENDVPEENTGDAEADAGGNEPSAEENAPVEAAAEDDNGAADGEETAGDNEAGSFSYEEFDLQLEFTDDREWEFEYERGDSEIERDDGESLTGDAAAQEIESLFADVNVAADRPMAEIKQEVIEAAGADPSEVEEFDLDVKTASGEEIDVDHEYSGGGTIRELDLDIDFTNGEDVEYEFEADDNEAEIERRDDSEVEGAEALSEVEALIGALDVTMDHSIDELKEQLYSALDLDADEVQKVDLDVEFDSSESIQFKHEWQ
ncbi:YusW family protein [Alkalicoccus urumqiensis]|uniref:YusW-like protein n=1 Tax=Alkalicoccus urumqiensis TaxID=1548213 RepID=A0A2P6MIF9_ALKUR|nr:YusW family protein [Alkalicoccus urumqiensis]PRO66082.1 hypothetical protein C6I21_07230 [Alkalicoccus urumqiensis]